MWPKFEGKHFESVASVILRVPGIFIIDYWWQYGRMKTIPENTEWEDVAGAVLSNLVPIQGFLLFILPLERLVDLYMYYISASILFVSHLFSQHYIHVEEQWSSKLPLGLAGYLQRHKDDDEAYFLGNTATSPIDHDFLKRQFAALFIHVCIASTVAFLLDLQHNIQKMMLAAYTLPVVARLSGFLVAHDDLHTVHNFASAFLILQVIYYALKYLPTAASSWKCAYTHVVRSIQLNGLIGVVDIVVSMLFVPVQFFLFWIVQMFAFLYCYVQLRPWPSDEWHLLLLRCTSDVCASPVSLLATSVALSYVSYFTLTATKFYLQGYQAFVSDNIMHSGWTEGFTMALIAVQTGLIHLRMPHRAAVMSVTLFIVFSSLIQSMFEITEPFLLALSASRSPSVVRHVRTLVLCLALFAFPLYMTHALCIIFPVDFWMLVVVSSCVMTSIQVLGLVAVYLLFMYDATRGDTWDTLDDMVYIARAVTRVLEFVVAVVVVGAGLRESISGQWSWINSMVLIIHCYFNVWQRLQSGWKSFLLRREAVRKIESLPVATDQELARYGDVCAICYAEMKAARVTPCKHYYHTNCIRKWLYVQDKCPMCHTLISIPEPPPEQPAAAAAGPSNTDCPKTEHADDTEVR